MKTLHKVAMFACVFSQASMADSSWASWFQTNLRSDPSYQRALASTSELNYLAADLEQPLYNPELSIELEHEGSNNARIGLSQTIDLWGKRDAGRVTAEKLRLQSAVMQRYNIGQLAAARIRLLLAWQYKNSLRKIAKSEQSLLSRLKRETKRRFDSGDIRRADWLLVANAANTRQLVLAEDAAEFQRLDAQVQTWFSDWTEEHAAIPEQLWAVSNESIAPLVEVSTAKVLVASARAEQARLDTWADPTVGIVSGYVDRDEAVSVEVLIPLFVRNTGHAKAEASQQRELAAVSASDRTLLEVRSRVRIAKSSVEVYTKRLSRWRSSSLNLSKTYRSLWRNREISMQEYLIAVAQTFEHRRTGAKIEYQLMASKLQLAELNGNLLQNLNAMEAGQ